MQIIRKFLGTSIQAWWPAVLLVIFAFWLDWLGLYRIIPNLDIPMHFFGGLLSAYGLWQYRTLMPKQVIPESALGRAFILVGLTGLITICWETFELWLDMTFDIVTQPSIADTIFDQWIGLLGALVFLLLVRKKLSTVA